MRSASASESKQIFGSFTVKNSGITMRKHWPAGEADSGRISRQSESWASTPTSFARGITTSVIAKPHSRNGRLVFRKPSSPGRHAAENRCSLATRTALPDRPLPAISPLVNRKLLPFLAICPRRLAEKFYAVRNPAFMESANCSSCTMLSQ